MKDARWLIEWLGANGEVVSSSVGSRTQKDTVEYVRGYLQSGQDNRLSAAQIRKNGQKVKVTP